MKCEKAIQSFFEQEDSLYMPLPVRLHVLFCQRCRKEIRLLRNIFAKAHMTPLFAMPVDSGDLIMKKILKSDVIHEKSISSLRWLFAGAIIFAGIIMLSYSDSLIWLRQHFGSGLEIPLNIVLGVAITLYAASFIGTHIDGAKRIAKFINSKIHQ